MIKGGETIFSTSFHHTNENNAIVSFALHQMPTNYNNMANQIMADQITKANFKVKVKVFMIKGQT